MVCSIKKASTSTNQKKEGKKRLQIVVFFAEQLSTVVFQQTLLKQK